MDPPGRVWAWGLEVVSELPLPGAMRRSVATDAVDLTITYGSGELSEPGRSDGPYRLVPGGFEFTMPGVARYRCTRGTIVVDPGDEARTEEIAAMLVATVVPAVLWMRGDVVLHAAAAILPGTSRAVAVVGASGSGKSSLLARAAAMGADIVADDSIRLLVEGGDIRIAGLPGGYFGPSAVSNAERPFFAVPLDQQRATATLGTLVVLGDGAAPARLTGVAAATALLLHRHRPRITRLLGTEACGLAVIADICRCIPIYGIGSSHRAASDGFPRSA